MKLNSFLYLIFALALTVGLPYGCVDNDFDEPPTAPAGGEDPDIDASQIVSVSEVLASWIPGDFVEFTEEQYMQAVVIANDESGNFFKTLILQEEGTNGKGIAILIDAVELNSIYFEGRRVFINLQGLYIGDFNGLPQLGTTPVQDGNFFDMGRLPEALLEQTVLPGVSGIVIEPRVRTISSLGINDINTLIRMENLEFSDAAVGGTFADPFSDPPQTLNLNLQDCIGNSIVLRNSGFSEFAADEVPSGNGDLIGVFGVFGTTDQMFIRDPEDLSFTNTRCNGTTGGGNETQISIGELRDAFSSGANTAPEAFVVGTVISDGSTGNIDARNIFVQDGERGIVVRFQDDHSFDLGDEIKVVVTGLELSEFRGLLQVNEVPNNKVTREGTASLPDPRVATIADIFANINDWESTRVLIEDATLTGTTFGDGVTVTDATGSIDIFTRFAANFSDVNVATGTVDVVAIISEFDGAQLLLNNAEDAGGDGGMTGGGDAMEISIADLRAQFESGSTTIGNNFIRGVVISDFENGNTTGRNAVVQNGDAGIVVRFGDFHPYTLGTEIEVDLSGMTLSEFNGTLQIDGVDLADAEVISGMVSAPTPRTVTVADLTADKEAYESTLVRIEGVSLSGASTYAGTVTVSDASGSIDMFTRNDATFSGSSLPSGNVNMTAVVSEFNVVQVFIRNLSDIN